MRIVVTSREALGVAGEAILPIASLTMPDAGRDLAANDLGSVDACRLFVERARAVQPSFELTDRNAGSVAQLCRRLDGMPLAIELAAARVRTLPVEQIAARLDDRFRLLTGGSRASVARHQTLRATIDWSYDLLTEPERAILRRLSVFAGGATLEAAEFVCAGDPVDAARDPRHPRPARREVAGIHRPDGGGGPLPAARDGPRVRPRAAWSRRTRATPTLRRHRDWYLALVEEASSAFFQGPNRSSCCAGSIASTTTSGPRWAGASTSRAKAGQACGWPPDCGATGRSGATSPRAGAGSSG